MFRTTCVSIVMQTLHQEVGAYTYHHSKTSLQSWKGFFVLPLSRNRRTIQDVMDLFHEPVLTVRIRSQEDEGCSQSIGGRFMTGQIEGKDIAENLLIRKTHYCRVS